MWVLFPPPVIPISVMLASPGPLTTQPIIETVKGFVTSSSAFSNFFTVSITGNCCLAQEGHEIIFMPLFLNPKLLRISKPTFTSSSGSSDKETLIVSPIPWRSRFPIPIDDFISELLDEINSKKIGCNLTPS